ncbi:MULTISPECIES: MarR family winged helix-turn-helix transcriptional regulator [Chryseobacterium]|uniref:MarR family winged helix-turn-helix transcriptional regulator n=1 Tax=Chryseobacterium TaxID=59732 RepID=UPI000F4D8E37|nr:MULTISPECIES: MarR family transcriptional regulator [Chryseobacterium]AZB36177.1 MarR family transcriptional regulator [Chryseobacterium bernardetii]UCA60034.1 MarR family transcriptional regulator [Chryseobacterium rhizoplanae]
MNKDNTFSVQKAEDSSGFLLWQVTNLWQREIKKALSPFDLTHSQFVILANTHWLSLQKTEVTQIILSQHTKIDPMTTSQVLRALQKKEFISRKEHTTDTRAKTIEITAAGKKIIKKAVIAVENFDREFFSKLENSQQEFNRNLQSLLKY